MAIEGADLIRATALMGAGLAMGIGAIGPAVGEGFARARLLKPLAVTERSRSADPYHAGRSGGYRVHRYLLFGRGPSCCCSSFKRGPRQ